jgi:coenzyme F420 hydrogenase subunit beta
MMSAEVKTKYSFLFYGEKEAERYKTEFGVRPKTFEDLFNDVINAGKCTFCGGCFAACPFSVIGFENELPKLVGACYQCELCWHTCPRTIFDYDEMDKVIFGRVRDKEERLGIYIAAYAARSNIKEILDVAQDGGIATTLLAYSLDKGIIDSAVASKRKIDVFRPWQRDYETKGDLWRPWPDVVFDTKELIRASGTKYSTSPVTIGLRYAVEDYASNNVGIVGVPCEVQTIRKMQYSHKASSKLGSHVKFVVGLFCMESFWYKELLKFINSKGVDINTIRKFAITKGKFIAYAEDKELFSVPLDEIKAHVRGGCHICGDFTAEYADISVGSVGSPDGWSTVIVRTKIGEEIFKGACEAGYIESKPIEEVKPGLKAVLKLSDGKKERYQKHVGA